MHQLNLIERWFRDLPDKRIRRGCFEQVPELIAAIGAQVSEREVFFNLEEASQST